MRKINSISANNQQLQGVQGLAAKPTDACNLSDRMLLIHTRQEHGCCLWQSPELFSPGTNSALVAPEDLEVKSLIFFF